MLFKLWIYRLWCLLGMLRFPFGGVLLLVINLIEIIPLGLQRDVLWLCLVGFVTG